ncbi:ribosomal protein L1 [Lancefieldella rimae ATCC 49626]|uniref:Large ribosomal subunit protein uL1 n=3 Tax=Lancefieldella rimae TaxID=1383 RepID=B9CLA0_LANR4|nr:ribosomal protein L1 [Lancefieldella rimae ATCC 49626]
MWEGGRPLTTGGMDMSKHGKNYTSAAAKVERAKLYSPKEAMTLAKELASAKFDETVEVAIRLGVDTRKADQNVRGSISLPHGTGKSVRVAVFAEGEKAREAEAAGADLVGGDELVEAVQKGNLDFDAAIATPQMMGKVGKLGRILGPRGLMPNPKLGTVTMDVAKMVSELKAGRVEYRADRYGICHVPMGKASFEVQQLVENYGALLTEILRVKPSSAKGKYVKSVVISSTMGPGIKVDSTKVRNFMED